MKYLVLAIIGLGAAFGLYRCLPHAKAPTPAVVVQQAHEAFPKAEAPYVVTPSDPSVKLAKPVVPKRAKVLPRPAKAPLARQKHVERLRSAASPLYVSPPAPVYVPEEYFVPKCLFWFFGEFGCK